MIPMTFFFSPFFTPLQQFQLLAIGCLCLYALWIIYGTTGKNNSTRRATHKEFRLEITAFVNGRVRIGLHADEGLSDEDISEILISALPVIGRKDAVLLKLLFYHSLEALEGDADIQKALTHFYEEVGETISATPQRTL